MSEVYIRSQNKEKLYRLGGNYACVEYGEYEDIKKKRGGAEADKKRHVICISDGCLEEIGEYATKERCLEVLDEMQKGVTDHKSKLHHGKQTLRQLMKHNTGVSNIEITDRNIRAFSATAKKYGIDFALKKDTSGEIPRYLVFFKGRDADVITAAFREFSAKNLEKEKKPSIRKELEQAKQQSKAQHRQREKVKTKDRGVEL